MHEGCFLSNVDLGTFLLLIQPFSSSCDHVAIHFSVSYPNMISNRQNRCFLDFYNAEYMLLYDMDYKKDIDWSFLCHNSFSAVEMFWSKILIVLHSSIAQFVHRCYQPRKPFSYPKHIRSLL